MNLINCLSSDIYFIFINTVVHQEEDYFLEKGSLIVLTSHYITTNNLFGHAKTIF